MFVLVASSALHSPAALAARAPRRLHPPPTMQLEYNPRDALARAAEREQAHAFNPNGRGVFMPPDGYPGRGPPLPPQDARGGYSPPDVKRPSIKYTSRDAYERAAEREAMHGRPPFGGGPMHFPPPHPDERMGRGVVAPTAQPAPTIKYTSRDALARAAEREGMDGVPFPQRRPAAAPPPPKRSSASTSRDALARSSEREREGGPRPPKPPLRASELVRQPTPQPFTGASQPFASAAPQPFPGGAPQPFPGGASQQFGGGPPPFPGGPDGPMVESVESFGPGGAPWGRPAGPAFGGAPWGAPPSAGAMGKWFFGPTLSSDGRSVCVAFSGSVACRVGPKLCATPEHGSDSAVVLKVFPNYHETVVYEDNFDIDATIGRMDIEQLRTWAVQAKKRLTGESQPTTPPVTREYPLMLTDKGQWILSKEEDHNFLGGSFTSELIELGAQVIDTPTRSNHQLPNGVNLVVLSWPIKMANPDLLL
ncbi:hypothetical protein AB1Y20_014834 [Prymnesium parvum]|uniref:Uncharacterized protein n=1 Tax=Prymnesium parvum TaxID=97485 RepID=A0AB34JZL4_PRYPA